jgi:DNA replication and repair protein RecF
MIVKKLTISNFRNYENANIEFKKGLNVIVGKNAQGKTNLIESIYFCCIGKSPRVNKDKDLINWNKDKSRIYLEVEKQSGTSTIEILLDRINKKTIKINDIPIKKISELLGVINVIYFSPDELKLIKEAPEDRRKFLDIDISQASKNYFYLLQRYNKILMQRNKLLKESKDFEMLKRSIDIWDIQLSLVASKIIFSRIKFIKKLEPYVKKAHSYLSNNQEDISITYQGVIGDSSLEIENKLLSMYKESLEKDYKFGFTTVGPHRDDLKILVNNIDVRYFGSQGQQRTAALSLKLGEVGIFKEELNETPVLLLDDVLSELDDDRQLRLLNYTKGVQTLITCTKFNAKVPDFNIIHIEKGQIY